MTAPTRTEFEAAAYRALTTNSKVRERVLEWHTLGIEAFPTAEALDTAIAAAMGWATVPEVKS